MHLGVDSFVSAVTDPSTERVIGPAERMAHLLEEIALADEVGLYSFGIGEHHRSEYYDSAPPVILGAAAARTSRIRLGSAVAVLSAADPVRVFQQFATLDLISKGRIDLVVGRGSFVEAFPLFGLDLADYDELFEEKLDLLLRLRESERVTWSGRHRPALTGQGVYPRPLQDPLPIWVGVRRAAGTLGRGGPPRAPVVGGDNGGRAAPVRAAGRPLPPGRCAGGPSAGGAEGRAARVRVRRRQHAGRGRHDLPGLARDVREGEPGARLRAAVAGPVRRDERPGRRVLHGRPRHRGGQVAPGVRTARRGRPHLAADDQPPPGP